MPAVSTAAELHAHGLVSGIDNLLCCLIGKAVVGIDDRAAEPLRHDLGKRSDFKDSREAELGLVRTEGAELVGELFRKHRDSPVHQIHRCPPLLGLLVHDRPRSDIMCDIGDMDADLIVAALKLSE